MLAPVRESSQTIVKEPPSLLRRGKLEINWLRRSPKGEGELNILQTVVLLSTCRATARDASDSGRASLQRKWSSLTAD
jgi:hypothetical protein